MRKDPLVVGNIVQLTDTADFSRVVSNTSYKVNEPLEATLLGKKVSAPEHYDPSILVFIPRVENRKQYGITNKDFWGYDRWNCYECSCLNALGRPIAFGLTIVYSALSEFIVESKSLKLYLNSFNMERLESGISEFIERVKKDLEAGIGSNVEVDILTKHTARDTTSKDIFGPYPTITAEFTEYKENPALLLEGKLDSPSQYSSNTNFNYRFNGFRSNCKITNQADFATVYIMYEGNRGISREGLAKYLTSFRNENHFHEECCELIYKRILEEFNPRELSVICNYTRRGGIDITPVRSNKMKAVKAIRTLYQ